MSIVLKQSTAVDVLIGPFVDLTDGATAETGESPSVKLSKNGQTLAAKNDATTPVHDADGYYNCELDATDTNTVGSLVLTVAASATALPVRHELQVVEENVYDATFGASAALGTDVASILADTNELQSDDIPTTLATLATSAALATVDTNVDAVLVDTGTTLPATLTTIEGKIDTVDTNVDAVLVDTGTTLDGKIDTVDTVVDAIKAKTDSLTFTTAGLVDSNTFRINDVAESAARLERAAGTEVLGTCDTGGTTTSVVASSLAPTSAVDDQFNGRIIIFARDTTTAALRGQATDITDYAHATTTFTVTALTTAPVSGDTFVIV